MPSSASGPQTRTPVVAYVALWFPLSSETFVFREVCHLREQGLPVRVYTIYGERLRGCSREMRDYPGPLRRMGLRASLAVLAAFGRALLREPARVRTLLREALFRRMRDAETQIENAICFFAGFLLAEECRRDGVELLHAPWANGPATACWVASRLTGIPFAFTGRARDIYPQDGILREKARDAALVRTNNAANVDWLRQFCPPEQPDKVHLVYNSLTFGMGEACAMPMQPPFQLLAVGRFVRKKGFDYLLSALARLREEGLEIRLTLVGDGVLRRRLCRQVRQLGLQDCVEMPGFVPHDRLRQFLYSHDLLVMPSVHASGDRDGIPNVIMEALSHSMPVVATDVCGIGEVVRDGETGFLVPQRDVPALAGAVRRMLEDREGAARMARAGSERVRRMFDPASTIQTLCKLYLEACRNSRTTAWHEKSSN